MRGPRRVPSVTSIKVSGAMTEPDSDHFSTTLLYILSLLARGCGCRRSAAGPFSSAVLTTFVDSYFLTVTRRGPART